MVVKRDYHSRFIEGRLSIKIYYEFGTNVLGSFFLFSIILVAASLGIVDSQGFTQSEALSKDAETSNSANYD